LWHFHTRPPITTIPTTPQMIPMTIPVSEDFGAAAEASQAVVHIVLSRFYHVLKSSMHAWSLAVVFSAAVVALAVV